MYAISFNKHKFTYCSKEEKIEKYFFSSSACAYNKSKQQDVFIEGLKEEDAYPADPEDGYGWEKLFSERMCRHFQEDYGIQVRIARYHNIYGPYGTYDGGREKAPAALCRKVINAKKNNERKIDVWGDGKQTRTFLYVDDCVEGTLRLFESDYSEPVNIGSDEQVSINQMLEVIESISGIDKLERNYQLDKPKGVRGRSSNNDLVKKVLNWSYTIKLKDGLEKTYNWISSEINKEGSNISRFTKS
jgi:GDP-D-mannose 3',5'-epimerase